MPRPPRVVLPGQPLHLIQRGNNRAPMFLAPADVGRFRHILHGAGLATGCAIHAYVFMTNHVHLLVTPEEEDGPARLMQALGRHYVRWFNTRHRRTGTLWEGRYRSAVIDSERYFLTCSRYIELNPVRAGMVRRPEEYPWSSVRANALGKPNALITPHTLYTALGRSATERQAAYQGLLRTALDDTDVARLRRATQRGTVLGRDSFVQEVAQRLDRPVARLSRGGDRRTRAFRERVTL